MRRLMLMASLRNVLFLVVAAAVFLPDAARADDVAASIDCTKPSTAVEHAICGDKKLAATDRGVAVVYAEALGVLGPSDAATLRAQQQDWLKLRDQCGTANPKSGIGDCLDDSMSDRLVVLNLILASKKLIPAGPSFDCRRASTAVEHEICGKPYLAAYDRVIADFYSQALGVLDAEDADQLRADQRAWLKMRDNCNYQTPDNPHATSDVEGCLAGVLMFRVNDLQKIIADKTFSRPCHPQNC
jgi:uncharacterized protein